MPSSSPKQARFMAAAAHDPEFARRNKVPQWVAEEFNSADKGTGILRKSCGGALEGETEMKARHKMSTGKAGTGSVMEKPNPKGEPATTIPGIDVMKESKQKSKGFKKGGGVKSESVAADTTGPEIGRLDKPKRRASGGAVSMRGRSPLSAAASTSAPSSRITH